MNYYPFHLGDYASHTGHLEPMEDLAYRRLLDLYYLKESPLPADIEVTAKLVRMRSMAADVESVLKEFFVLTDKGWVNPRADVEIAAMREKQEANEIRDSHERERMRRHRERRSEMFEALREFGVVPAWDVSMKELQRLFDNHCNANSSEPETHLQREQVVSCNALATAIPTPTPTPTPKEKPKDLASSADDTGDRPKKFSARDFPLPETVDRDTWRRWCEFRSSKRKPISEQAARQQVAMLAEHPPDVQSAIVQQSIQNDYQGLFQPKGASHGADQQRTQPVSEIDRVNAAISLRARRREAEEALSGEWRVADG